MSNYKVEVLVNDKPIQVYHHEGSNYIEGRKGSNFSIKFTNNTYETVLAIPSVDGLSTISGEPASSESDGYIVYPKTSITIPGWKLSNEQAASFFFSEKEKSYSATNDIKDTSNVGCIGFIVFSEKTQKYNDNFQLIASGLNTRRITKSVNDFNSLSVGSTINIQYPNISATIKDDSSYSDDTEQELGTGFGESTEFKTREVSFEKDKVEDTIVIYYDSRKNLEKMGIVIRDTVKTKPNPFPGNACKPPVGWNG